MKRRDYSEDLVIYEKIILEWILGKLGEKIWSGRIGSG